MADWRDVPGYEGRYQASSDGRIRSLTRRVAMPRGGHRIEPQHELRTFMDRYGYECVGLWGEKGRETVAVHRVIARTFLADSRFPGAEVRHCDGNQLNNTVSNLRWGTASQNRYDSVGHGTHRQSRKTHCPKQHEYSSENTWIRIGRNGRPFRTCRECARTRAAARRTA